MRKASLLGRGRDGVEPNESKEDNEAINKLAAQMAEKTPQEDIAKIRANLDNMTVQQRELMNQKGVDPLVYFFRTQAAKEYRRQKMNAMAARRPGLAGAASLMRETRAPW